MPIKLAAFKKKEKQQSALHQYRSTTSSSASPESCTTSKYFTKVTCHFRVTVAIRPQHVFVQIRPQLKKNIPPTFQNQQQLSGCRTAGAELR